MLLAKCPDRLAAVNRQRDDGTTPVNLAAGAGQAGAVQWLIERGADVNLIQTNGNAPLKRASQNGHPSPAASSCLPGLLFLQPLRPPQVHRVLRPLPASGRPPQPRQQAGRDRAALRRQEQPLRLRQGDGRTLPAPSPSPPPPRRRRRPSPPPPPPRRRRRPLPAAARRCQESRDRAGSAPPWPPPPRRRRSSRGGATGPSPTPTGTSRAPRPTGRTTRGTSRSRSGCGGSRRGRGSARPSPRAPTRGPSSSPPRCASGGTRGAYADALEPGCEWPAKSHGHGARIGREARLRSSS